MTGDEELNESPGTVNDGEEEKDGTDRRVVDKGVSPRGSLTQCVPSAFFLFIHAVIQLPIYPHPVNPSTHVSTPVNPSTHVSTHCESIYPCIHTL